MSGDRTVLEAAAQRAVDFEKGAGTWDRMLSENTSSVLAARCRAYETLIGAGFTPRQTRMPAGSVVVVPIELTQKMIVACLRAALFTITLHKLKAIWPWYKRSLVEENTRRCWAAMIAARPGARKRAALGTAVRAHLEKEGGQ